MGMSFLDKGSLTWSPEASLPGAGHSDLMRDDPDNVTAHVEKAYGVVICFSLSLGMTK